METNTVIAIAVVGVLAFGAWYVYTHQAGYVAINKPGFSAQLNVAQTIGAIGGIVDSLWGNSSNGYEGDGEGY